VTKKKKVFKNIDRQNSSITQSPILSTQVTLQASPSAASHADLIKQLNQARAQGLVVLQQWGDKQVSIFSHLGNQLKFIWHQCLAGKLYSHV
jgi:hypothetical protein